MIKRWVLALILVMSLGLAGFSGLAWRSSISPTIPPVASSFEPNLVAQGEKLAGAGDCATCHTVKGGAPFAGGLGIQSAFGTIFSTNITPDRETGIGLWSEVAFRRALHEGVARDGAHLFPAFPFDHFTKVSDADVAALYAYFMTRAPVSAVIPANTLPFPLNIRALQEGWKLLFFRSGELSARPDRSPVRGGDKAGHGSGALCDRGGVKSSQW